MFRLVVLSCAVAIASASAVWPYGVGHLGLGVGHLGVGPWGLGHLGAPAVAAAPLGVAWGAPIHGAYNYRGPLSLAPGQPANILAADGRPLDTLSVNLDRAAHITAQAVNAHGHLLKKRSAPLLAGIHGPVAVSHTSRIDLPGRLIAPVGYAGLAGPVGLAGHGYGWGGPVGPYGLGLGPWGGLGYHGLGHW